MNSRKHSFGGKPEATCPVFLDKSSRLYIVLSWRGTRIARRRHVASDYPRAGEAVALFM